jgi:hypothetical protein
VVTRLPRGGVVSDLHAHAPSEAIAEFVRALGSLLTGLKRDERDAISARVTRTPRSGTLEKPLLALGRSTQDVAFVAPDGRPASVQAPHERVTRFPLRRRQEFLLVRPRAG